MGKFTSEQTRAMARNFNQISRSLADYRFDYFDQLNAYQRKTIEGFEWKLLQESSYMTEQAIHLSLDDLEGVSKKVVEATDWMARQIKKLDQFESVVNVAGVALGVASAIVSGGVTALTVGLSKATDLAKG